MKNKKRKFKGVSLMEVIIVVAITSIFATVVTVNLYGARQRAKDSSALQTATSVAPLVYKCLKSQYKSADNYSSVRFAPYAASGTSNPVLDLCCYYSGNAGSDDGTNCNTNVATFSKWPDISGTGWSGFFNSSYTTPSNDGFYFCPVGYTGGSHPSSGLGGYDNGVTGGDRKTGKFCFMFKNVDKYIWCTENGCQKEGF